MTQQSKLIHLHTTAGCISQGWRLLADNIWNLLRGSWPTLFLFLLWGVCCGIVAVLHPLNIALWRLLTVLAFMLILLAIMQVALLVRHYHRQSFFPQRGALRLWRDDSSGLLRQVGAQFMSILHHPGRWGSLLAILLVGLLVGAIILLVGSLPQGVLAVAGRLSAEATAMGDAAPLPSHLWILSALFGGVAAIIDYVAMLPLLLSIAFFVGSLRQEEIERQHEAV